MLHKLMIYAIISSIWGVVIILGVSITVQDTLSIEDKIANDVKQTQIVNSYNAEIIRCDNIYTDNSPSWSECIKNASLDFGIDLLYEDLYRQLRNQMKAVIEN